MITFIIIVVLIIVIIKASKPDKKDTAKDQSTVSMQPPLTLYGKSLSKLEQVANLVLSEHVIASFSYSDGCVNIKFKDGGSFYSALSDMEVRFMYSNKARIAKLEAHGKKRWLQEVDGVFSKEDWDQIFRILTLAGTTYDVDSISAKARKEQDEAERNMKTFRRVNSISNFLNG